MLSLITRVTSVTFSQADACVKGKKGLGVKGFASLPPLSPTGGCWGPQRRGSLTASERCPSTELPPPQGFPSAGSLPRCAVLEEHAHH